ncbi:hypothetical protein IFT48_10670 [Pseudomonas fluorescens]|uniref:hypothetical protein n=1 Tax=Pseudomonas fluorescens TaxID=294 RepID=UPI001904AA22|nr:hypothetical protein [Pseudomonas fluorescens]MBD8090448.1 hypothetical protein [Pseudomonas fluorescens]MBD8717867.1 hypothetical protein [Pseudomonas fluorescens]
MYPVDANKNVVIVLGMHRSGTSAIAAGLEQLGLVMGSSLFQGDEWNPKGYFEERRVVEFNNRLLALYDRRWDSPLPPSLERDSRWDESVDEAVDLVRGLFGDTPAWGFKDPRMCQLAPFWGQVFSRLRVKPKLMMVVRNPTEVAHSLARRDGISAERAAWLWMTHLFGALEYLDVAEDMRFFAFDHLLNEPAAFLTDVADWLSLTPDPDIVTSFASDFIAPALTHGADTSQETLPPLVVKAYEALCSAIKVGMSPRAFRESVQWKGIIDQYQCDIIPELISVQKFFQNDRQLSVMESRIGALSKGLEAAEKMALDRLDQTQKLDAQLIQTSDALARAEQIVLRQQEEAKHRDDACSRLHRFELLAVERLEQMQKLDAQMNQTSDALARAEKIVFDQQGVIERQNEVCSRFHEVELLAIERLEQMQRLDAQLLETSAALSRAERIVLEQQDASQRTNDVLAHFQETELLAIQRLEQMQQLDAQLLETSAALNRAERIVSEQREAFERTAEVSARFREAELLAIQRLEQMQKLDAQLMETSTALARAEQIVLDQHHLIARQDEACSRFRETELLAIERLEQMQKLDAQLIQTSAALALAERLVSEQQEASKRSDEMQLHFQEAESLAFERLEQMQKLDAQLMLTSNALAYAEQIVGQQQEALELANLQASNFGVTQVIAAESLQDRPELGPKLK